ncbi:hypothetical protein T439DRAFT_329856 [Meredithblackwellia eburnea MCA 4105]
MSTLYDALPASASLILRPMILPALIVFAIAPPATLRAWIAVRSLAPPPALEKEQSRALKKRRLFHFAALAAIVFGVEYWFFSDSGGDAFNWFFIGIWSILVNGAFMSILVDLTGAFQWAAYRANSGRTLWRFAPGSVKRFRLGLVAITSLTLTAHTFLIRDRPALLTGLISTAMLYRFVVMSQHRVVSIRGIMLVLVGWIATSFALAGVLIALAIKLQQGRDGKDGQSPVGPQDPLEGLDPVEKLWPRVQEFTSVLTSILFAAGPGILIAACYRFDYSHHLAQSSLSYPVAEEAERKVCTRRRRRSCSSTSCADTPFKAAPGAIVPLSSPTGFPRTLYAIALSSWVFAQAAVVVLFAMAPLPDELRDDPNVFDLSALVVTIPVMVVSVVMGACVTGRAREMWTYREQWVVMPVENVEGAIKLEEGEEEGESLPAYEEEVGVPSYPGDVKA